MQKKALGISGYASKTSMARQRSIERACNIHTIRQCMGRGEDSENIENTEKRQPRKQLTKHESTAITMAIITTKKTEEQLQGK